MNLSEKSREEIGRALPGKTPDELIDIIFSLSSGTCHWRQYRDTSRRMGL
jgi:hypothetical protein